MSQVPVKPAETEDEALAKAYQTLGVRPDCHDLVLGSAYLALLVVSTSPRHEAVITAAYQQIRRAR
jgi:hypothetical protein